ncbi:MAG: head completion/stabilization protein [Pseudomonas sp.]
MQSENEVAGAVVRCHRLACHDPFWPTINLDGLRYQLKLSALISDARLEVAALAGTHKAAGEFAQWRRVLRARGYQRLADLASHQRLTHCYMQAVQAHTRRALDNCLKVVDCVPDVCGERGHG